MVVVVHTSNLPGLGKQRHVDLCGFKANLIYKSSSKIALRVKAILDTLESQPVFPNLGNNDVTILLKVLKASKRGK